MTLIITNTKIKHNHTVILRRYQENRHQKQHNDTDIEKIPRDYTPKQHSHTAILRRDQEIRHQTTAQSHSYRWQGTISLIQFTHSNQGMCFF